MDLMSLLTNKIFLSIVLATGITQLIKIVSRLYKLKKFSWHDLFRTGGMPSSHSALVVALVLSIFLSEGFSTAFFVSLVFFVIVLRDAMGVRRTVGEEGKVLQAVVKKMKVKAPDFRVSIGHTPLQVVVGLILGIVITSLVFLIL